MIESAVYVLCAQESEESMGCGNANLVGGGGEGCHLHRIDRNLDSKGLITHGINMYTIIT